MIVTNSFGGFVADQMWYNLESARYLRLSYYKIIMIIIIIKYILVFVYIYLLAWMFICNPGFPVTLLRQSSGSDESYL